MSAKPLHTFYVLVSRDSNGELSPYTHKGTMYAFATPELAEQARERSKEAIRLHGWHTDPPMVRPIDIFDVVNPEEV